MNIKKINFNKLFMAQKAKSNYTEKSKEAWDKRAKYMDEKVSNSIYNTQFIDYINTKYCRTVLDIGCGVGNISLRISEKFQMIYALDYSCEMLKLYKKNAVNASVKNYKLFKKSWDDNFTDIPKCDLVIASRAMQGLVDIEKYLLKLNSIAKKRVYLSYKTTTSFYDKKLYEKLYIDKECEPDYIYLLNILYSHGIYASLNFIESESIINNEDFKSYRQNILWHVGILSQKQEKILKKYYEKHIKNKKQKNVRWALISWEKKL